MPEEESQEFENSDVNSDKKITSGIDGASVNRLLDEHLSLPSYYFTFSVTDKPKDGYYVNKVIYNDKEVSVPKKGESKETSIDGRIYTVSVDANGTVTVTGPSIIQNNLMFTHAEIPKEVKAEYTVEIYYQLNGKYAEPMGIETRTGKTGTEVSVTDADKTSEKENYVLDESMNDFYTGTIADDGSLVLRVYFKQQMTLTFDLDGGTLNGSTDSVTLTQYYGDEITILDAPEREGYTFLNWKGSEYQPGDSYTVTEDHIFTAQWEEKDRPIPGKNYCPVTWDPNGGIFNESSYPYEKTTGKWLQPAYKGTEIVILSAPKRDGYTFMYWECDGKQYKPGQTYTVTERDKVFTAQWEKKIDTPKTGDESNMMLWIALMGASILGACVIVRFTKSFSKR